MAHFVADNQYGREGCMTDEYGNPVHSNTGHHGTDTAVARAVAGSGHIGTGGTYPNQPLAAPAVARAGGSETGGGHGQHGGMGTGGTYPNNAPIATAAGGTYGQHGGISIGTLHRSGSGSSSSSEDDGQGGRRKKKGVIEKIKEKLPGGGHSTDEQHRVSTTTIPPTSGGVGYGYRETHEKKGTMEKIKEYIPGNH